MDFAHCHVETPSQCRNVRLIWLTGLNPIVSCPWSAKLRVRLCVCELASPGTEIATARLTQASSIKV
jgi:hypothetical protein